jgi:hypothetical protein
MSAATGRRALSAGLLVLAGVLAVTVPGRLVTPVLMPGASGTVRALVVTAVMTGVALAVRPCFGPWAALGVDRPRSTSGSWPPRRRWARP